MNHRYLILIAVFCFLCAPFPVFSQETGANMEETAESGIEDELYYLREESHAEIMVFTGLRYEHKLSESPSAISVITKEEIRRSPFRNIPELLQYVVGMD